MQAIWESSQIVKASEVDVFNRLKITEALNYLQDAASAHATQLGLGFREMHQAGLFWVLSWIRLEFSAFPHFGNQVIIQTWPKCPYKMLSIRDFILKFADGTEFCRASSAWLVVDAATTRAVPLERLPQKIAYQSERVALSVLPEKLTASPTEVVASRTIQYSDLDVNMHVNNVRYVEFVMDCYSLDFHRTHQLKTLTMSFLQETKYGEQLNIALARNGNQHIIEQNKNTPAVAVWRGIVEWQTV